MCFEAGKKGALAEDEELPSASNKGLTQTLGPWRRRRSSYDDDLSASALHVEYELSEAIRTSLVALLDLSNSMYSPSGARWGLLRPIGKAPGSASLACSLPNPVEYFSAMAVLRACSLIPASSVRSLPQE